MGRTSVVTANGRTTASSSGIWACSASLRRRQLPVNAAIVKFGQQGAVKSQIIHLPVGLGDRQCVAAQGKGWIRRHETAVIGQQPPFD